MQIQIYPESLAGSSDRFRLLHLLPGLYDSPVQAQLTTYKIRDAPPFIAISYAWGTRNDFVDLDLGSQQTLRVSTHVRDVLRELRRLQSSMPVWIDVVTIDQSSVKERASQVSIMRAIFASATWVYVWLGMAPHALEIVELGSKVADDADTIWKEAIDPETKQSKCLVGVRPKENEPFVKSTRDSWHLRKWVNQEIAVVRNDPLVLYDGHLFDGQDFFSGWRPFLQYGGLVSEDILVSPWKFRRLWRQQIMTKINGMHMGKILEYTRYGSVSDPHDSIFAVIGLAFYKYQAAIPIDYEQHPEDLFQQVSLYLWQHAHESYHALKTVVEGGSLLDSLALRWHPLASPRPSWACNFEKPVYVDDKILIGTWTYLDEGARSAAQRSPSTRFDYISNWKQHRVLTPHSLTRPTNEDGICLSGLILDTIRSVITRSFKMSAACFSANDAEQLGYPLAWLNALAERHNHRFAWITDPPLLTWHMFTTSKGHIGSCFTRGTPAAGDCVAFVLGATMALVLRPELPNTNAYSLVDVCTLSNDVCGCAQGGFHDATQYQTFELV